MSQANASKDGTAGGLVIGRALGAPIVLSWTWFIAAILITALLAPFIRTLSPSMSVPTSMFVAFLYAILLFTSVFLHEFAHGVAGTLGGQKVSVIELNVWGGFTKFEPKIDDDAKRTAMTSFYVSIVGPVVNIILAAGGWIGMNHSSPGSIPWLLCAALTFANVALGVINLLPGIPLDGGWALQALIWRFTGSQFRGTMIASLIGRIVAVGFVVGAVAYPYTVGSKPDLVTVIWMTAIAVMLWVSAADAAAHAKRARRMETYDLDQVIQPAIAAAFDADVEETLRAADAARTADGAALVVILDRSGLPTGLLNRQLAERSATTVGGPGSAVVGDFSSPLGAWIGVPRGISAPHLLESLTHRPKAQFCLIMEGSTLAGIIDLQEFFHELLED